MSLGLLRVGGEPNLERDLELVASDYRSHRPGVRRVLLNEEPIYVAGQILGMDVVEVDALPDHVWDRYREIYAQAVEVGRDRQYLKSLPWPGPVDETAPYTLREVERRSGFDI
ncbi:hypothetical protein [Roseomonas sp. USHLN139]|uniref:hypothetical protein n=1 Tax=Roseomonas sp. USHLN139 TaxID=3081298 RepID=UPI003B013832